MKTSPCPKCRALGNDRAGDNLINFGNGHHHCFACSHHVFPTHFIPREVKPHGPKSSLPFDFTRETPAGSLRWLLQFGLPWSYWKDSIGYSPSTQRLVFLVGTPVEFSIGRYVGTSQDGTRKWHVWGDSHKAAYPVAVAGSRVCALVEDVVSAHKVASAGITALPLFGTKVYPAHLKWLMENKTPIIYWLDKDQHGSIMRKTAHLQGLTGLPVRFVVSEQDPKYLTSEQIVENLKM